ncbi:unnamed protein product [Adineta ricciae]|uniref:Uncharacterized protein n=1 Tax=Adineta ricciae TaxID=249248 RepID=A0A815D0H9_ADIRI|nr:unnamed protein product [Adineta ricciae]CAF1586470.1 unnamed protein product [Adineta ricciae]
MSSFKTHLLTFNLFKSSDIDNEHQRRANVIATHVYWLTLVLILINVGLYTWTSIQTNVVTLKQPTKKEFEILPIDAQCPCSRISLSYGEYSSLQATFNQVCSSDFVSDRWIKALDYGLRVSSVYPYDFRGVGNAQFDGLAALCRLARANVQQNLDTFARNTLISPYVLSENIFQSNIQAVIAQFQSTLPNRFKTQLQLLLDMTFNNQMDSGLATNFVMTYDADQTEPLLFSSQRYKPISGPVCNCYETMTCTSLAFIYAIIDYQMPIMTVPGIMTGCLPLQSLLASSLECFFNQTCVDRLISFFPTNENFTAMSIINQTIYERNATVQSMVNGLMIEKWITSISYEKYYAQCAPISCTYTKIERPTLGFILTRLIGLLSGLILVLRVLVPKVIHYIEVPENGGSLQTQQKGLKERWFELILFMKTTLITINIFNDATDNDDRQTRYKLYASRLYILLVVLSLLTFINYRLLRKSVYRETFYNPTEFDYLKLAQSYPTSLSCPCTSISIPYSKFLYTAPHYHQICSSDLISSDWLGYVSILDENTLYYSLDYRLHVNSYFRSLKTFCEQAKETIDNALEIFLQTQFVGSQVLSRELFESQMNSSIENWQSETINQFQRTIQLLRATTQGNQLMNHALNVDFHTNRTTRQTTMKSRSYSSCSCSLSSSCSVNLAVYNNLVVRFYVPTLVLGCFIIDSLFQSSFECFYNRSCMLQIDQYLALPLGDAFHFSPLNSTWNSPNETAGSIIQNLMVDSWSSNISFTSYYGECAAKLCTYEEERRENLILLITVIISIFGGLSLGFKILLLVVLRLINHCIHGISRAASIDFLTCRNKKQATKQLEFVLVATILYALYINAAFVPESEIVQIEKPSLNVYQDLMHHYPDTLQCSCSKISIQYETFLTIKPRFHQICSSVFVSQNFINYQYDQASQNPQLTPFDFQFSSTLQFRLLSLLCQMAQETVTDTLLQLANTEFINTQLLSSNVFNLRIQTVIQDFRTTFPQLFLSTLALIRETTGANRLMTALGTSWKVSIPYLITTQRSATLESLVYEECSCASSPKCIQPSNGMFAGCYPLEALFQSTLACFYDQECIDKLVHYRALNVSSMDKSRFQINTTIESFVNQLMVEDYSANISYENYFHQCSPLLCTYSYTRIINVFDGLTYLISVYGGLVILCRMIVNILMKVIWFRA